MQAVLYINNLFSMWSASIFFLSFFFSYQPEFHAPLQDSVIVGPESSITVTGSSTLHDWDAVSSNIQLSAALPETWFQSKEEWNTEALSGIEAVVPVESLESGRRKMNSDIREALHSEQYPEIKFISTGAELLANRDENGMYEFRLNGNLSIAGQEREVQFSCTMREYEDQKLRTICETEIDMTDFEVDPPTAFFGALKTDETVTFTVDLVLTFSKEKS